MTKRESLAAGQPRLAAAAAPYPRPAIRRSRRRTSSFADARRRSLSNLFRGQPIVLTGRINGIDAPMMLDSGAGMTISTRAFARQIGLRRNEITGARHRRERCRASSPRSDATARSLQSGLPDAYSSSTWRNRASRWPANSGGPRQRSIRGRHRYRRLPAFASDLFRPQPIHPAGRGDASCSWRETACPDHRRLGGRASASDADLDLGNGGTMIVAN